MLKRGSLIRRISRLAVCALLTAALLPAGCGEPEQTAEPPGPQQTETRGLSVREGALVDGTGAAVQLRGMSTHGIAWFPQYANANAFRFVKEAGGNVIRVAMYTDTENGYLARPEENLLLVRKAVEDALALGLYVIVDWHILSDGDPMAHLTEAITFFDAVASSYRDEPSLLYEICNEPNGVSWERICEYAYAIVPVIRQYAPKAVIIVGTPEYSSGVEEAIKAPLPMDDLMYAYHFYAGEKSGWRGLSRAVEQKFPVFVSEWGVGLNGGTPAAEDGAQFVRMLNEAGVSWCAWSLCNKDEPYSMLRPECGRYGGFLDEDLSPAGLVYRDALGGIR